MKAAAKRVAAHFEQLTATTERLDGALPGWFAPSRVKIDVEGAELEVLEVEAIYAAQRRTTFVARL